MAMSSPASPAPNQGEAPSRLSAVYNVVMTPVIFVSFLVSLAWVDFRYSIMRSHNHSDASTRMPRWLHSIVYCEAPYQYVRVDRNQPSSPSAADTKWYYHTKQRKLMKMEAEDAFRIRGSVLVVLGLLAVTASWVVWRLVWWLLAVVTTRYGSGAAP